MQFDEPTGRDHRLQGETDLEREIADALTRNGRTAATAESLTGGNISARLSALPGASDWYVGGVVAYDETVKFKLLGVDRGPVITAGTAVQMADGVARLLNADVAVATTGVGGPGPQENKPQGTVFVAVASPGLTTVHEYHFDGDPGDRQAEHAAGVVRPGRRRGEARR
jgi:nicotinamide-nucleotide amidase